MKIFKILFRLNKDKYAKYTKAKVENKQKVFAEAFFWNRTPKTISYHKTSV